jgi:RNA polymerase sigma-70 factor (ECF subfamily)
MDRESVADDGDLRAHALAGDRDAWSRLVALHDRRVIVALLARGVAMETAKEIAQQTWLRLVEQQRLGRLTELKLPGLAIAQALFLAKDRLKGKRLTALNDEAVTAIPDTQRSAEDRLVDRERLERARVALAGCSPRAQQIFSLAYEAEVGSHDVIAREVGLSVQRVRQVLCEVRETLRRALRDETDWR